MHYIPVRVPIEYPITVPPVPGTSPSHALPAIYLTPVQGKFHLHTQKVNLLLGLKPFSQFPKYEYTYSIQVYREREWM